jgi:tyrosyl-tRNA synthetase
MFGKLMSISDALMARYYTLLLGEELSADVHPMEAKKALAARIVERYHDEAAGIAARQSFEARFSRKAADEAAWPEISIAPGTEVLAAVVAAYQQAYGESRSNGDARRLIQQGSIQRNGEKLSDPKAAPDWQAGDVLKLDKKRSVRLV